MDDYFKLPTGYACLARNGDNIYAYNSGYTTRDTYELANFRYVKIATESRINGYTVNTCYPSDMAYLIPASFGPACLISISLFITLIIKGIFYVFRR